MTLKPTPLLTRWLALAGFVLLIFGGKLWFISFASSDLPTWDQWDGESACLLQPWLQHELSTGIIFHPHNEHRVVSAKLYALGLFLANDNQWSVFVETVVNAAIHTLCALSLLLISRRWLRDGWLVAFGALLVLLFTLPFSWENTLYGFQVSFYFMLLFSLGQIVLTVSSDRFGWRWICGQFSALLATVTLASGFFASLAVLAVLGHRFMRERRWTAQQATSVAVAIACCVAGWLLKVDVQNHAALKVSGPGQFLAKLADLLTWPAADFLPWALVLGLPALLFAVQRLRRKTTSPDEAVFLGLLAWIVLQCLATAYARGGGPVLAPRYFDLLSLNIALGFIFLVHFTSGRPRRLLAATWLAIIAAGLLQESRRQWDEAIVPNIGHQRQQEINVRAYLLTGDTAHLLNKPWSDVPYPDPNVLIQRISPPVIKAIMPPSVRRPVSVVAQGENLPSALPADLSTPAAPLALSTWGAAAGRFRWRSAVQPATTLPVLRFRLAGDLGAAGHPLHLVVKSSAGAVDIRPDFAPAERWKTVSVFRPAGPWWLEAEDDDPDGWFAFTAPVEVGRLSWLAEKLLKHHSVVLLAGLGLLAAAAGSRRLEPEESIA